jgi:hypothetical protein
MGIEMFGAKEHKSSKLYHRDIGFPQMVIPTGRYNCEYSQHALEAAHDDRYGQVDLPDFIDVMQKNIIEIEVSSDTGYREEEHKIVKMVVRVPYDEEKDLVLAFIPHGADTAIVKTMWFNTKGDSHRTLDRYRYTNPRITRW